MEEQARFPITRAEDKMKDRVLVELVMEILVALGLTVGPVLLLILESTGRWS